MASTMQRNKTACTVTIDGCGIREGTSVEDLACLKKICLPGRSSGELNGLHVHCLLVICRILPRSQVSFDHFVTLASRTWNMAKILVSRVQAFRQGLFSLLPFGHDNDTATVSTVFELTRCVLDAPPHGRPTANLASMDEISELKLDCISVAATLALLREGIVIDCGHVVAFLVHLIEKEILLSDNDTAVFYLLQASSILLFLGRLHGSTNLGDQLTTAVDQLCPLQASLSSAKLGTPLHNLVLCLRSFKQSGLITDSDKCDDSFLVVLELFLCKGIDVNCLNGQGLTALHVFIDAVKSMDDDYRYGSIDVTAQVVQLLDAFGQHWDAHYGRPQTVLDSLRADDDFASFVRVVDSRMATLQCLAARAALTVDCSRLPRRLQEFVDVHRSEISANT